MKIDRKPARYAARLKDERKRWIMSDIWPVYREAASDAAVFAEMDYCGVTHVQIVQVMDDGTVEVAAVLKGAES